jgi:hypothetical protein
VAAADRADYQRRVGNISKFVYSLQNLQSTVTSVTDSYYISCIRKELLLGHCSRTFNRLFIRW